MFARRRELEDAQAVVAGLDVEVLGGRAVAVAAHAVAVLAVLHVELAAVLQHRTQDGELVPLLAEVSAPAARAEARELSAPTFWVEARDLEIDRDAPCPCSCATRSTPAFAPLVQTTAAPSRVLGLVTGRPIAASRSTWTVKASVICLRFLVDDAFEVAKIDRQLLPDDEMIRIAEALYAARPRRHCGRSA